MFTNNMYFKLGILKFEDVCNYFLLSFLRKAFYKDHLILEKYFNNFIPSHDHQTRGFRLILPRIRLDMERNFTVFSAIEAFNK